MTTVGDKLLKGELDKAISDLESAHMNPPNGVCEDHGKLCTGMLVLLKIEQARMSNSNQPCSLKVGNVALTGSVPVIGAMVVYALLKLHNVL